jgi:hypothetical protein
LERTFITHLIRQDAPEVGSNFSIQWTRRKLPSNTGDKMEASLLTAWPDDSRHHDVQKALHLWMDGVAEDPDF